jgi:hypothetical protein
MKLFSCSTCAQLVFFENVRCTKCDSVLAFLPDQMAVGALERADGSFTSTLPSAKDQRYRLCQNSLDHGVCNWAIPLPDEDPLCRGCRLNDVIPDLSRAGALLAWGRFERAKKRLLYTLYELGLPVVSRRERPDGLLFSFEASDPGGSRSVLTGHDHGRITFNIAEADDPSRERLREQLGETYRTVLGHFRHEIGHYYWDQLVRDGAELAPFRELFGDPAQSYQAALERHYAQGAPADWQDSYVSAYASSHPWEDWAETWAHYLHIVDTLGAARSYGLALRPEPVGSAPARSTLGMSAKRVDFHDFDELVAGWLPLTIALNSINRAMGLPDLYPFVLSPRALEKLRFVHGVIERGRA